MYISENKMKGINVITKDKSWETHLGQFIITSIKSGDVVIGQNY